MKFKYIPVRKQSPKGKLRKEIGNIHWKILQHERGYVCEICRMRPATGRFHIMNVSTHQRLEFCDENILIACWFPCHNTWHHFGGVIKKTALTRKRIAELRGEDWEEKLEIKNKLMPKHDEGYLRMVLLAMKQKFKELTHG